MAEYIPTREDVQQVIARIERGAAELRNEGANAAQVLAERGYADADAGAWAADKASAAQAAEGYAAELRAELAAMQPTERMTAARYAQAEQVAKASELGGILIDGRPVDEANANNPTAWYDNAKAEWEAGTSYSQTKAAEIDATGVFEHVAETIDGVEQVPFWRLAAAADQTTAGTQDERVAQAQADELEYGVGDDVVVEGVVYDGAEWMPDGEGGVKRRDEWRQEQGIGLTDDDGRGWASPEASAAARDDLERRAAWHEARGEQDYAADLRVQAAAEYTDDADADGM